MQIVTEFIHNLPLLRRYARAVTGSQHVGDDCVALMLERLSQRVCRDTGISPKIALYRELNDCLHDVAFAAESNQTAHIQKLPLRSRQAMLLTSLEGLTEGEAALVLGMGAQEFSAELDTARRTMGELQPAEVLIIEDEFFISRDLSKIVTSLGHRVIARARTHAEARSAVTKRKPNLILADVHLADETSGIDAVNEFVAAFETAVIFITAYPERLLTGLRAEPTFIIAKPYHVEEVKSVISQCLFFGKQHRESLEAPEPPKSF